MQTKLIEILSSATGWMTSAVIAKKGKWRSPANVGVALQQMEKANGSVVRRKSPNVKMTNGMPATEWKLEDKQFDELIIQAEKPATAYPASKSPALPAPLPVRAVKALEKNGTAMPDGVDNQVPVVKKSLVTETGPTNSVIVDGLNAKIDNLESDISKQRVLIDAKNSVISDLKINIETAETDNINWLGLAREYECKNIPELRVFISSLIERVEKLSTAKSENVALKTLNESMPGFGAAHQALSKGPFVIRIPGKPAIFSHKFDNAKAAAMSAARQKRGGEVFALIPVGKAIRGAEWKGS